MTQGCVFVDASSMSRRQTSSCIDYAICWGWCISKKRRSSQNFWNGDMCRVEEKQSWKSLWRRLDAMRNLLCIRVVLCGAWNFVAMYNDLIMPTTLQCSVYKCINLVPFLQKDFWHTFKVSLSHQMKPGTFYFEPWNLKACLWYTLHEFLPYLYCQI